MFDASLIIPIFNEDKNIKLLFNQLLEYEVYKKINVILFVNDCSTDKSLSKINEISKKYPKVKVITNNKNMGQSYSIYTGAKYLSDDTLITIDGDCQNNPKDIFKLLQIYFSMSEIFLVGGIRTYRRDNYIKRISSIIANQIRKKILQDECDDTGCSLKVFDRNEFLKFPFFNGIHRFLPALFKGFGKKTYFVSVDHKPRIHGYSKYGTFDRLFVGIKDIIKVKKIIRDHRKKIV